ncbi:tetratricopeptide repeat protein [Actinomadura bangladeshensis]|uniref:Tetratricopeptide repeat protein n=1 Tax=Actinomadura bangladeshensis TaxID=453573 RepID=A0A4R4NW37_9ACTN|nr:hypothetical protein [Actinomadura bangladeshensis]TDC11622.1 hypothetical protein E1284_27560 [Actinomadura bangladeshensis]
MKAVEPDAVNTAKEFAAALDQLRGGLSYGELDRKARNLRPINGRARRLPKSTLGDLLNEGRTSEETLRTYLAACEVQDEVLPSWIAAWMHTKNAGSKIPGSVRVEEAQAIHMGVHRPITAPGANSDLMPTYILRDLDVAPSVGLRSILQEGRQSGEFILLVGESSTGKTRTLFEAVKAELIGWRIIRLKSVEDFDEIASDPPRHHVLWLDELQGYLSAEHSITAESMLALLEAGNIAVATLWPQWFNLYTSHPQDKKDPYVHERNLLKLARVIHVAESFSASENERAREVAKSDARVRLALQVSDFGLTQTIAAAPQLIERWNNANPYARAVLTAAYDAFRLGVFHPIPVAFLRAAAVGYCDDRTRARAPKTWFDDAIAYATEALSGATAALSPIAVKDSMEDLEGFIAADYLAQYIIPRRSHLCPPETFWQAAISHLSRDDDISRLGESAKRRARFYYADELFRRAAAEGDALSTIELAESMIKKGEELDAVDLLNPLVEAGYSAAIYRSADALRAVGLDGEAVNLMRQNIDDEDEIGKFDLGLIMWEGGNTTDAIKVFEPLAEDGDDEAEEKLMELLYLEHRVEDLVNWTASPHPYALEYLAHIAEDEGQIEESLDILQYLVSNGNEHVVIKLAELLSRIHREDEAIALLREKVDQVDIAFLGDFVQFLLAHNEVALVEEWASDGLQDAVYYLAPYWAALGKDREAIQLVENSTFNDFMKGRLIAEISIRRGDVQTALQLVDDAGNDLGRVVIASLAEAGEIDAMMHLFRRNADAGEASSVATVAQALSRFGHTEQARRLFFYGLTADGTIYTPGTDTSE